MRVQPRPPHACRPGGEGSALAPHRLGVGEGWGVEDMQSCEGALGSVWFSPNRYTPYPNLYPDQSPSEDWTMEERFRPLTFHGLILRSQLVTLLVRGVCYSESQSVSLSRPQWDCGGQEVRNTALPSGRRGGTGSRVPRAAVEGCMPPHGPSVPVAALQVTPSRARESFHPRILHWVSHLSSGVLPACRLLVHFCVSVSVAYELAHVCYQKKYSSRKFPRSFSFLFHWILWRYRGGIVHSGSLAA